MVSRQFFVLYGILPVALRLYELVRRPRLALVAFKQILLSIIQLIWATFSVRAYSIGLQQRVDELYEVCDHDF